MGMQSQRFQSFGRWALISALIVLATGTIFFFVSLPPASGQSGAADVELLTKQIDFILKMNSAFLGFLGIIGALLTWFFKNNLEDAKEVARTMVRQELDSEIKKLVRNQFEFFERSFLPEKIVDKTRINYYVPNSTLDREEITEIALLEVRGFRRPIGYCTNLTQLGSLRGDITVLDLQHAINSSGQYFRDLPDEDKNNQSQQIIEELLNRILSESAILIVYFNGYIKVLNSIKPPHATQYLLIANNPVTLVGHSANGAYVAIGN